ncbi:MULTISPECIES: putative quinol monooxygenase [unclassified Aeromicrobium]|jgi:quinol monooxygenase YgiN|uniref:putative quinol monooxygenase n=1 Tax=unclassified Aeromicrobium TaxID=2633570 RepID=UPI0010DE5367|nr:MULTISPECIES: putative quinol monooxygenase [unclassified Aeromicrobium]RYY49739.1 MAG: antibiotic biosynthesis monooxygenase [Actinomycetales bacterium]
MILIVVKFAVRPEHAETFPEAVGPFTEATRAEPGNLFFEWSRSLEDEHTYVLVEGFEDDAAEAHVSSDHFAAGLEAMRPLLVSTPQIISHQVPVDGWGPMGELQID